MGFGQLIQSNILLKTSFVYSLSAALKAAVSYAFGFVIIPKYAAARFVMPMVKDDTPCHAHRVIL